VAVRVKEADTDGEDLAHRGLEDGRGWPVIVNGLVEEDDGGVSVLLEDSAQWKSRRKEEQTHLHISAVPTLSVYAAASANSCVSGVG
jgi:hypothetical protein